LTSTQTHLSRRSVRCRNLRNRQSRP